MHFETYLKIRTDRIEQCLTKILNSLEVQEKNPERLLDAMRYSLLNGGKRVRPLLVYATGEALGSSLEKLDAPAAAIELIHCYSLIHDDLPQMDNDDLRRGKPSCHKAFDEATAILAGDTLQALAFQILADPELNPISAPQKVRMIYTLASRSGFEGMAGGQALDLQSTGNNLAISLEHIRTIHRKKTGALIEACVILGALSMEDNKETEANLPKLQEFARYMGLAFQIQDDILDVVSDTETLGKNTGKDKKQNKITFPGRLGLKMAQQYAKALHQQALESIEFLNEKGQPLVHLSDFFVNRIK